MTKQMTFLEAEAYLNKKYYKKFVEFTYPGYPKVTGRVDRTGIDISKLSDPQAYFMIGDTKYSCSLDSISECIKKI